MDDKLEKYYLNAVGDIDGEINIKHSIDILHKLADTDNYLPAIRRLGVLYGYKYEFIEQDFDKSSYYLNKAIEKGDIYSRHVMGRLQWYRGEYQEAINLFSTGSGLGYLPSQYWLSSILDREDLPYYDAKRGLRLLKDTVEKGHVPAMRLYISKIIEGKYGFRSYFEIPFLFAKIIYRVTKFNHNDPDDFLVR